MIEILYLNLKCLMIFRFSAPYPYLLDDIKFCFHLNPIFRLLPSKLGTVKKIKTLQKNMADNSEPAPSKKKKYCVKLNDSWCYKFKYILKSRKDEGLLYVLRVEVISVLHIEEKMISIDTRTHQTIRDNDKEN